MTEPRTFRNSRRVKIVLALISIALIVLMFPKGESLESEINVGSIWIQDDLIASKTFEVLKDPTVYQAELLAAENRVLPVFTPMEEVYEKMRDSIRSDGISLLKIIDEEIYFGTSSQSDKVFLSTRAFEMLKSVRRMESNLSAESKYSLNNFLRIAYNTQSDVYKKGLLDTSPEKLSKDSIAVRDGKFQRDIPVAKFYEPQSTDSFLRATGQRFFPDNEELVEAFVEYVGHFLKPNYVYREDFTKAAEDLARESVPRNIGIVTENERIIAKHDRVTPEIKLKIDSYRIAKGSDSGFVDELLQTTGMVMHIILILTFFTLYISLFRREIFTDNLKLLLIAIIFLISTSFAYIASLVNVNAPIEMLIFLPVGSMLLTIFFDSRIGFHGTVAIALIIGALRGNDYVFALINIIAGGLASYTVRDIKNRNQIFRSFLFILLGYLAGIFAFGFEQFAEWEDILIRSAYAASNALISPVLTFGLIIFFEKSFKLTTDLTLLELSDFNAPLLKNLAKNASGTFTHSMTIGTMVENAAEMISASTILARVGAYYHDIGKSFNPEVFVENQIGEENIHDKLSPQESVKRIIAHVKKGIEAAEGDGIPKEIIDFIPMHHGTLPITYFYEKAKEEFGEENILIDDYRYPGPKPNTKETALVMLADACESTVRAMVEPTPEKIENVINNLIKFRIDDGQLDEAPLSYHDIKVVKNSFLEVLISQHHKRIRYPQQDEMENESES